MSINVVYKPTIDAAFVIVYVVTKELAAVFLASYVSSGINCEKVLCECYIDKDVGIP